MNSERLQEAVEAAKKRYTEYDIFWAAKREAFFEGAEWQSQQGAVEQQEAFDEMSKEDVWRKWQSDKRFVSTCIKALQHYGLKTIGDIYAVVKEQPTATASDKDVRWIFFRERLPKLDAYVIVKNDITFPITDAYRTYFTENDISHAQDMNFVWLEEIFKPTPTDTEN